MRTRSLALLAGVIAAAAAMPPVAATSLTVATAVRDNVLISSEDLNHAAWTYADTSNQWAAWQAATDDETIANDIWVNITVGMVGSGPFRTVAAAEEVEFQSGDAELMSGERAPMPHGGAPETLLGPRAQRESADRDDARELPHAQCRRDSVEPGAAERDDAMAWRDIPTRRAGGAAHLLPASYFVPEQEHEKWPHWKPARHNVSRDHVPLVKDVAGVCVNTLPDLCIPEYSEESPSTVPTFVVTRRATGGNDTEVTHWNGNMAQSYSCMGGCTRAHSGFALGGVSASGLASGISEFHQHMEFPHGAPVDPTCSACSTVPDKFGAVNVSYINDFINVDKFGAVNVSEQQVFLKRAYCVGWASPARLCAAVEMTVYAVWCARAISPFLHTPHQRSINVSSTVSRGSAHRHGTDTYGIPYAADIPYTLTHAQPHTVKPYYRLQ